MPFYRPATLKRHEELIKNIDSRVPKPEILIQWGWLLIFKKLPE